MNEDPTYGQMLATLFYYPQRQVNLHGKPNLYNSIPPEFSTMNETDFKDDFDNWNSIQDLSTKSLLRMKECPPIVTEFKKWVYSCYKNEVCCDSGCCIVEYKKLTHFWYAWFVITILGLFLLACFHYYKKQRLREYQIQRLAYRRQASRLQHQQIFDLVDGNHHPNPARRVESHRSGHGAYINFLRQYEYNHNLAHPTRGVNDLGEEIETDDRLRWNSRVEYCDQLMGRCLGRPNVPASSVRYDYEINPINPGNTENQIVPRAWHRGVGTSLAPPPSYETLMDAKQDDPPPIYLEACKLIAESENEEGDQGAVVNNSHNCVVDHLISEEPPQQP